MKHCPYCDKIITRCIHLPVLLGSGTHHVFCECCHNPIVVVTKSQLNIDVKKGDFKQEAFYSIDERRIT